jgi:hypothetical protein
VAAIGLCITAETTIPLVGLPLHRYRFHVHPTIHDIEFLLSSAIDQDS